MRFSRVLNKPLVERFAVELEGAPLATLVCALDGKRVSLEGVNLRNEGLSGYAHPEAGDHAVSPLDAELRDRDRALPLLREGSADAPTPGGDAWR